MHNTLADSVTLSNVAGLVLSELVLPVLFVLFLLLLGKKNGPIILVQDPDFTPYPDDYNCLVHWKQNYWAVLLS